MRLINADQLKQLRDKYIRGEIQFNNECDLIDKCPTIDAEVVVHGRWIGAPLCGNDNCQCSECGSWHSIHVNLRGEISQKYCPSCGAKMDKK